MANFEFLKGNIETIILASLYGGDKYGYEIAKEIKERTNNTYEIKQPTLYSYLKKLESQSFVEPYWGEESNGGRRKYYRLTPEGKKNYESFSSEWKFHKNVLDNLVVDEADVSPMSQVEATPIFGQKSKPKRQRKTPEDLISQQQSYQSQLSQLLQKNEQMTNQQNSQQIDSDDMESEKDSEFDSVAEASSFSDNDAPLTDEVLQEAVEQENADDSVSSAEIFHDKFERKAQELLLRQSANKPQNHAEQSSQSPNFSQDSNESEAEKNYRHIIADALGNQLEDETLRTKPKDNSEEYVLEKPVALENIAQIFSEQGVRVKVYNKETSSYRPQAMLYKNKLLLATSFATYFLCQFELLILWLFFMKVLPITVPAFCWLTAAILPIVFTVIYLISPAKKTKPNFDFKYFLTNTLLAFGLLVILIFAFNVLILKIVFSDTLAVLTQIVIPCIVSLGIPTFVVFYKVLFKSMLV